MTSREQFEKWIANEQPIITPMERSIARRAWEFSRAAAIEEVSIHYFRLGNIALATDIQRLKDKK